MIEKYFCCQTCGGLIISPAQPIICPHCKETDEELLLQGLERFSFKAKKELAEHKRIEHNKSVTKEYRLKRGK